MTSESTRRGKSSNEIKMSRRDRGREWLRIDGSKSWKARYYAGSRSAPPGLGATLMRSRQRWFAPPILLGSEWVGFSPGTTLRFQ